MSNSHGAMLPRSSPATVLHSQLDPAVTSCWLGRPALLKQTLKPGQTHAFAQYQDPLLGRQALPKQIL